MKVKYNRPTMIHGLPVSDIQITITGPVGWITLQDGEIKVVAEDNAWSLSMSESEANLVMQGLLKWQMERLPKHFASFYDDPTKPIFGGMRGSNDSDKHR